MSTYFQIPFLISEFSHLNVHQLLVRHVVQPHRNLHYGQCRVLATGGRPQHVCGTVKLNSLHNNPQPPGCEEDWSLITSLGYIKGPQNELYLTRSIQSGCKTAMEVRLPPQFYVANRWYHLLSNRGWHMWFGTNYPSPVPHQCCCCWMQSNLTERPCRDT